MKKRPPTTQTRYPEFMADQRRFFDEVITQDWDAYDNPRWELTRHFELDHLFRLVAPRRIIDIGCGCGWHDKWMAEQHGVTEVVGVDYSDKSIEAAERVYPHPQVHRFVADVRELPAGEFDLAVSFQVIEHLTDTGEFLRLSAAQVRPGGWIAVATPNRLRLANRIRKLFGLQIRLCDPQHHCEFIASELRALGEEQGLLYVAHFGYGMDVHMPRVGWPVMPFSLGLNAGYWLPALADCFMVIFRKPE